jgi:hypothetical protein
VSIGKHLAARGATPEALREYETSRVKRVRLVALQSSLQGGAAYQARGFQGVLQATDMYPELQDFMGYLGRVTFEALAPA